MTVKEVILGGTDWIDGDVLYAADQLETLIWNQIVTQFSNSMTSAHLGTYANTNETLMRGYVYRFKSFTLSSATISIDSTAANDGKPVVILVDGAVAISGGTINLKGKGYAGGATSSANGDEYLFMAIGDGAGTGGTSGAGGGGGGATGSFAYLGSSDRPNTLVNFMNCISGSGGGAGGQGSGGGGAGGAGGTGGGGIIILSNGNLVFNGGTIDVSGNNGTVGADGGGSGKGGGGGGGAGSGGMVVLGCNGSLTNSGTITLTGGTGAAGGAGQATSTGGGGGGGGSHSGSNGTNGANATNVNGATGGNGGIGKTETFTW